MRSRLVHVLIIVGLSAVIANAEDKIDGFSARTVKGIPYRLFIPPTYKASEKYPLVLWLHGSDGMGTDNKKHILGFSKAGSHVWTKPENQSAIRHLC